MRKYTFFIGIDISKLWIDVRLGLNGDKSQMPYRRFDNKESGFKALLKFIRKSGMAPKDKTQWVVCMEHTGVYTLPLCGFLEEQQIDYALVNAHHMNLSLGLRRGKSDPADAADIARYAYWRRDELKISQLPSNKLLTIKNLLKLRKRLVKYKTGMTVAAKELKGFAPKATSMDVVGYTKVYIRDSRQMIKDIEKEVKRLIDEDTELKRLYDLVTSVKGVGFVIASTMIVYTHGFTAFDNGRQFATYIGIAPFSRTSGTSLNAPAKVSHLANKMLKGILSAGAESARKNDKELKAYFDRRIADGKLKYKVYNAIRNKFVHRIFAVVKRGKPYTELAQHKS